MTKIIILSILYFCITGLWLYIQVMSFDFSKCTEEQLVEVNDLFNQIEQGIGWNRQQAMQVTGVLGFILGWFIVPTMVVKRIWQFLTKGLTKSK